MHCSVFVETTSISLPTHGTKNPKYSAQFHEIVNFKLLKHHSISLTKAHTSFIGLRQWDELFFAINRQDFCRLLPDSNHTTRDTNQIFTNAWEFLQKKSQKWQKLLIKICVTKEIGVRIWSQISSLFCHPKALRRNWN